MSANVTPDVHVFHLLARSRPNEVNDVEVLKVTTNVVCEIDTMAWVAAGCSPVSGVGCKGPYSLQTQAVHKPVMGILVDWSVILERSLSELRKPTIDVSPGHHQGPCCTWLRLEVAVRGITVATIVEKPVNATCRLSWYIVINTGVKAKWFLINIRHRLRTVISLVINRNGMK